MPEIITYGEGFDNFFRKYNPLSTVETLITPKKIQIQPDKIMINTIDYSKIEKLEKQIDKMADFISKMDVDEEICLKVKLGVCQKYNDGRCKECIKKYFEEAM